MWHSLTALLTASTVLTHAVLGCCWHSQAGAGDGCQFVDCKHSAHAIAESGDLHLHLHPTGDCGHSHAVPENGAPATPGELPCEHSKCSYVWTDAGVAKAALELSAAWANWQVIATCSPSWIEQESLGSRGKGDPGAVFEGEAARVRARLQVWLV